MLYFRDKENATDDRSWIEDAPEGIWVYLEDMGYFKDDVYLDHVLVYCKKGIKRIKANLDDLENQMDDDRVQMAKRTHMKELLKFYYEAQAFVEKYDKTDES